jgi:hypothetical protein
MKSRVPVLYLHKLSKKNLVGILKATGEKKQGPDIQWYGSPDLDQNLTDPELWFYFYITKYVFLLLFYSEQVI